MSNSSSFFQDSNTTPTGLSTVQTLVAQAQAAALSVPAAVAAANAAAAACSNASNMVTGSILPALLPAPTASTLGAIESSTAPANQFAIGIDTTGTIDYAQPAFGNLSGSATLAQLPTIGFSNLSGSVAPSQLPAAGSGTLGGVQASTAPANQFSTGFNTSGVGQFAQPSFSNLSGTVLSSQLPTATNATLGMTIAGNGLNITSTGVVSSAIPGYLSGLTLSYSSTTVFGVATGYATSDDYSTGMYLSSAWTKSTSAWAAGTGNGALDTGAVAASTWYHVFLITKTSVVPYVVDVLYSLSPTAPTMPSGYTVKRRIGSLKTDASSHWLSFTQNGDEFTWTQNVLDVNTASAPTSATLVALGSVPTGVNVGALVSVQLIATAAATAAYVFPAYETGATVTGSPTVYSQVAAQAISGPVSSIRTNTSAQVYYVCGTASQTMKIVTWGWIDSRGK